MGGWQLFRGFQTPEDTMASNCSAGRLPHPKKLFLGV